MSCSSLWVLYKRFGQEPPTWRRRTLFYAKYLRDDFFSIHCRFTHLWEKYTLWCVFAYDAKYQTAPSDMNKTHGVFRAQLGCIAEVGKYASPAVCRKEIFISETNFRSREDHTAVAGENYCSNVLEQILPLPFPSGRDSPFISKSLI